MPKNCQKHKCASCVKTGLECQNLTRFSRVRFGQSGAVRELNLVQIVEEVSAIRGCYLSQTLSRHSQFLAGAARSVLVDIERGCASDRRAINYVVLRNWHVLDAQQNVARRSEAQPLFRTRDMKRH